MLKLSEIIQNAVVLRNARRSLKALNNKKRLPEGMAGEGAKSHMEQIIKNSLAWFADNEIDPDKLNVKKLIKKANSED